MYATKTITTLYNPGEKDKDELISEFVIRLKEFEQIFGDIKTSKMEKPEQHYLLLGQRGSGKSTLIQRLRYAIEDDAELNTWLIPIAFKEEQYNITELGNLWERIAEYMEDYYNMPGIVGEIQAQYSHKYGEKRQLDILLKHLREKGKKVVLFIDNIGDMLAKFEELEIKRLREVLQTIPDIRLIAASPVTLESTNDYQKAFYQFFKTIHLGGLNQADMEALLRKLGETHNSKEAIEKIIKEAPERIEILRRLTGGVTRTVVMMYNVFVENAEGNPIGDLQAILDEATPLYKHKMDDLPMQQQKIIDAVAKNWESISAGELAEKLRMKSKNVSAHLRQLEKDQWIEIIETPTKNNLYQLQERFFNIWYLMRYGRRFDKSRVIWLVKFMESWLDKEEISNRMDLLIESFKKGQINEDYFSFWREVYLECSKVSNLSKVQLIVPIESEKRLSHEELIRLNKKRCALVIEILSHPEDMSDSFKETLILQKLTEIPNENHEFSLCWLFWEIKNASSIQGWLDFLIPRASSDSTGLYDFLIYTLLPNGSNELKSHFVSAVNKGNLLAICPSFISDKPTPIIQNQTKAEVNRLFRLINNRYFNFTVYHAWNAYVLLLNNSLENSRQVFSSVLPALLGPTNPLLKTFVSIEKYVILLISKQQYVTAYNYFTMANYNLAELYRPIYFALMHYMKDEYPNEYLRMPPEMKETVDDVIKRVEEYREKYK